MKKRQLTIVEILQYITIISGVIAIFTFAVQIIFIYIPAIGICATAFIISAAIRSKE